MRSIYLNEAYEVEVRELATPACGPQDAIVRVHAGGVCGTDMSTYLGAHFKRRAPQVLGHEVSGEVVSTGSDVSGWDPGERVFVNPLVVCGVCAACSAARTTQCHNAKLPGLELPGLFSDLVAMPAKSLHRLPAALNWTQGALVEPTSVAHHAVGRAELGRGDAVAVLGAGPIGALAALICDHTHDARLLIADPKESNRARLSDLLGCTVVDPAARSVVEAGRELTRDRGVDVVLVANHSQPSLDDAVGLLRPGGRIVAIAAAYETPPAVNVPLMVWHELELRGTFAFDDGDVSSVIELIEAGLPVEQLVTHRHAPEEAAAVFASMAAGGEHIKTVFEFGER